MRKNSALEFAPSSLHCDIAVQIECAVPANWSSPCDVTTVMVRTSKVYAVEIWWECSGG